MIEILIIGVSIGWLLVYFHLIDKLYIVDKTK